MSGGRRWDAEACIDDIRRSAEAISRYVRGVCEQEFLGNEEKQDAVVRRIEMMGEAARRLLAIDPDNADPIPGVPLKVIYAMRNRVAHGYDAIDYRTVWNVAVRDIPRILSALGDRGSEL